MPQPTMSQLHSNRPLTNMSVAYRQLAKSFIADRATNVVEVQNKSNTYYKFDKDDWFRDDMQERAPGSESAGTGFSLSTDSYQCRTYALHIDIPDEHRENADDPLNLDRSAVELLTQKAMLQRDVLWQSKFFATSKWFKDWAGAGATNYGANQFKKWDLSGSNPLKDIEQAKLEIMTVTGMKPNVMVIGPEAYIVLVNNAEILDRVKYTQRGVITEELLASMFGLDDVIVANAVKNTAKEGASPDFAGSRVFGDSCLVFYRPPAVGVEQPAAMAQFNWSGKSGAMRGQRVRRIRMEELESDRIELSFSYDLKLIGSDLGLFLDDISG